MIVPSVHWRNKNVPKHIYKPKKKKKKKRICAVTVWKDPTANVDSFAAPIKTVKLRTHIPITEQASTCIPTELSYLSLTYLKTVYMSPTDSIDTWRYSTLPYLFCHFFGTEVDTLARAASQT